MDFVPLPFDVVASSIATGRHLRRHAQRAMEYQGLTWEQFVTLVVIDESGGMIHGGAIARRIGISRQAVSRTLARFDERGMIRIYADPWMRSVRLTDEGRRVLHQAKDALTGVFAAVRRVNVEAQRRIITAEGAIRVELHRPHYPRTWLERYMQPELWDDDDGL